MANNSKGTVYIKDNSSRIKPDEEKEEIKKLDTLADDTLSVIYEISSVFPFQIFPDKLIIDKNKVVVVKKELFFKRIFPILIEDLRTVRVNRGLLFAAMEFELKGFEVNPQPITHLWPEEASKAEKYIMGLIKAKKENVDLSKIKTSKVRKRIGKIGGTEEGIRNLF